jgi:endogenous inhibitor of DNA gyrase (YacG/DUF329 family)
VNEVRVRCPICKGETAPKGNPFRPFCSERCKLIDLDNWLSSRYRVSTPISGQEAAESDAITGSDLGDHDATADE